MNILKGKGEFCLKNILLKLSGKKSVFSQTFEICDYEDISIITVKPKDSAIRKIARKEKGRKIIIPDSDSYHKIYKNKLREFDKISDRVAFSLLDRILRQAAKEFMLKIPFGEIYIVAMPHVACSIIDELNGISRLFTVVSQQESSGEMYDELYFKYGSIIRHMPIFNNDIKEDTLIIRCNKDDVPVHSDIPVIDMCGDLAHGNRVISLNSICIYDKEIEEIQKLTGGKSGASLYTLFDKIPRRDALIDINTKCDKIFLLDTDVF